MVQRSLRKAAQDWHPLRAFLVTSLLGVLFFITAPVDGLPELLLAPAVLGVQSLIALGAVYAVGRILTTRSISSLWYDHSSTASGLLICNSIGLLGVFLHRLTREDSPILPSPPSSFALAVDLAGALFSFCLVFAVAHYPLPEHSAAVDARDTIG